MGGQVDRPSPSPCLSIGKPQPKTPNDYMLFNVCLLLQQLFVFCSQSLDYLFSRLKSMSEPMMTTITTIGITRTPFHSSLNEWSIDVTVKHLVLNDLTLSFPKYLQKCFHCIRCPLVLMTISLKVLRYFHLNMVQIFTRNQLTPNYVGFESNCYKNWFETK